MPQPHFAIVHVFIDNDHFVESTFSFNQPARNLAQDNLELEMKQNNQK